MECDFQCRRIRPSLRALTATFCLLALCAASTACEEDTPEDDAPSEVELEQLYTELCERSEECVGDPIGYPTVEECTMAQLDYYHAFPDQCIEEVFAYHRCLVDTPRCEDFTTPNGPTACRDLRDSVYAICDGGINL